MNGEAFRVRRTAAIMEEKIQENAPEIERCLKIVEDARAHLRRQGVEQGHILSVDAQLLYVAMALWTRDLPKQKRTITDDQSMRVGLYARWVFKQSGEDFDTTMQTLALSAALRSGVFVRGAAGA